MLTRKNSSKGQIALEFLVVYSFVLVIFILLFGIVASQRAATLSQQEYASLQLQTQNIANYIDQALNSGNGYTTSIPLTGNIGSVPYNLSVSTTGVVIARMKVGTQVLSSYAFSNSRNLIINGTLQQTGNGISIYLVPTYKGSLQLSNINGVIYVGQNPPATTSLPMTLSVTPVADVKVAGFNAQQAYIQLPNSAAVLGTADRSVSFWINTPGTVPSGGPEPFSWGTETTGGWFGVAFPNGQHTLDVADWGVADHVSATTLRAGNWYNVVITLSSSGTVLGLYINGVSDANFPVSTAALNTQAGPVFIGNRNDLCTCARLMAGTQVANFQIYSNTLTANQILALYNEGINGAPVQTNSLVAWLPLNGNMNDYSGNGNNGFAPAFNTINYSTAVQVNTHIGTGAGSGASNSLIGYVASKGNTDTGSSHAIYTSNTGNSTAFVTAQSNVSIGAANLTINGFNGNSTLNGNLLGWWPLDEGYGNTIHDLSTHYHDAVFNSVASWMPASSNQTNFNAGAFPGVRSGLSGANSIGWVTVNQIDQYLNLERNDSFTALLWAYSYGGSASHDLGIIGDNQGSGGQGFSLTTYTCACSNPVMFFDVNGINVASSGLTPSVTLPANRWEMIVAEYNGSTGQASLYLNNTQVVSNVITAGLDLGQATTPIYIADNPWQTGGGDTFNGLITNVQLYSKYLTPVQINAIYNSGITSPPIGDTGLVGWWPLNGNLKDYSSIGNNGIKNDNVTYANVQLSRAITGGGLSIANFTTNGGNWNYANVPYSSTFSSANQITMVAWVKTTMVNNGGWRYFVDTNGLNNCDFGSFCLRWCCGSIYTHYNTQGTSGLAFFSQNMINNGAWHMLASTYNGSKVSLYLDGIPENTVPASGALKVVTNSITLGYGYNGLMSDVQIYNVSLTKYQIQQLYLQGLPIYKKLNVSLG